MSMYNLNVNANHTIIKEGGQSLECLSQTGVLELRGLPLIMGVIAYLSLPPIRIAKCQSTYLVLSHVPQCETDHLRFELMCYQERPPGIRPSTHS